MRILRSLLNPVDLEDAEYAERLAALNLPCPDVNDLAFQIQTKRMARAQVFFDRDEAEVERLDRARPLGAEKPRVEPKSIDDPTPPGRIRWEAPKKRYVAPKPYKSPF
jgi:hypothetical protein